MKPLSSSCRTDYQKQVDNFPFIGEIAKPTEPATVKMNCTFHEPPLTASPVFADRQSSRSFGRWQTSERKPGHPAVSPVWNLLLTEKRIKEASIWMS